MGPVGKSLLPAEVRAVSACVGLLDAALADNVAELRLVSKRLLAVPTRWRPQVLAEQTGPASSRSQSADPLPRKPAHINLVVVVERCDVFAEGQADAIMARICHEHGCMLVPLVCSHESWQRACMTNPKLAGEDVRGWC